MKKWFVVLALTVFLISVLSMSGFAARTAVVIIQEAYLQWLTEDGWEDVGFVNTVTDTITFVNGYYCSRKLFSRSTVWYDYDLNCVMCYRYVNYEYTTY